MITGKRCSAGRILALATILGFINLEKAGAILALRDVSKIRDLDENNLIWLAKKAEITYSGMTRNELVRNLPEFCEGRLRDLYVVVSLSESGYTV